MGSGFQVKFHVGGLPYSGKFVNVLREYRANLQENQNALLIGEDFVFGLGGIQTDLLHYEICTTWITEGSKWMLDDPTMDLRCAQQIIPM